MKRSFWLVLVLLMRGFAQAQSLTGVWQGVETDTQEPGKVWPAVLRLRQSKPSALLGVLYQEAGEQPGVTVTFQMQGTRTAGGARLDHLRKLNETGRSPFSYWCEGAITFTYDPALEKLTGQATYQPIGNCDTGTFTFYRVKRKSAATVPAGMASTLRVSGRNVRWYTDSALRLPVATGNTFRTKLTKTTTFYLTQGYYPTRQSAAVPITFRVAAPAAAAPPTPPTVPADTTKPAILVAPTPVVLPTVLFQLGTPELLPEALPALNQLAAELQARPTLQLRIAGHTDRIGEPQKNQVLSEQRAEAVKDYLVQVGVAASRVSTVGYGDARPLYISPDARNRRVEVEVVEEKDARPPPPNK